LEDSSHGQRGGRGIDPYYAQLEALVKKHQVFSLAMFLFLETLFFPFFFIYGFSLFADLKLISASRFIALPLLVLCVPRS
jgi:hypothetical protein